MNFTPDTIVAAATPPGRGGVAIVRVSGTLVTEIAAQILTSVPKPRYATYTVFYDQDQNPLDEGIALFFPGPNSFTGEDILELHCHGGIAVVDCLIKRVLGLGGRLAKPGEFSERAFLNNKIDLAQAEAIADLIDAATEQAARSALRSLQGEFSAKINQLITKLINLRMYIEAAIDFVEEEIDFLTNSSISQDLQAISEELIAIQAAAKQGCLLRDGMVAVIIGKPNVGKSTLLNCLSGHERAIVTDIAGTTRDILREQINLDGLPLHIIDTAGLRESNDPIEQEGIRRAYAEINSADIILYLQDASSMNSINTNLNFLPNIPPRTKVIIIRNKIDLTQENPNINNINLPQSDIADITVISISAKNNMGIDLLKNYLKNYMGFNNNNEGIFSARRRHIVALTEAQNFINHAHSNWHNAKACELLAEDLRLAQQALSEITGEFTADDLLGKIFGSFCVGK